MLPKFPPTLGRTRTIELSDSAASILDSRALVYFRLGRMDEALADLDAALDLSRAETSSLYLRGIIRKRQGKAGPAAEDLAAVALTEPTLPAERRRYGIMP